MKAPRMLQKISNKQKLVVIKGQPIEKDPLRRHYLRFIASVHRPIVGPTTMVDTTYPLIPFTPAMEGPKVVLLLNTVSEGLKTMVLRDHLIRLLIDLVHILQEGAFGEMTGRHLDAVNRQGDLEHHPREARGRTGAALIVAPFHAHVHVRDLTPLHPVVMGCTGYPIGTHPILEASHRARGVDRALHQVVPHQ